MRMKFPLPELGGFKFTMCQPCYDWIKKYSHMDDPYRITRMRAGTPIEDEIVKKAIRYAKVKTADTAGKTE